MLRIFVSTTLHCSRQWTRESCTERVFLIRRCMDSNVLQWCSTWRSCARASEHKLAIALC